ncbi:hypothetical protein [Klebsiella pneumoniae]|uniref:hypothetical protein n=1 Tax=Klebsiella pneumoniae TaxID=573 RepID=UPI001D10D81D|nr:hypothetical protein [Klebsiella pneumoniae]
MMVLKTAGLKDQPPRHYRGGIRLERSILTIESRGRGQMPRQLTAEIAGQLLSGKTLKKEQMRAVTEIVTSKIGLWPHMVTPVPVKAI